MVLEGEVKNILWTPDEDSGDEYEVTTIRYKGEPGEYEEVGTSDSKWSFDASYFVKGEKYSMKAGEVHSIFFAKGTSVLFFEGPQINYKSIYLQPVVDGETIPTFKIEPWMFKSKLSK